VSKSYWRFVKPIWDTVSIYDGGEVFLSEFQKLTDKQKVLFASHWAQSEIMNGGLGQFFANQTGVLAPEAVEAFNSLGMPECSEILKNSMGFFGEPYPRDRSIRDQYFENFYEEFNEDKIPLKEYEVRIATVIEDENGGFESAADNYANKG
jgi:hypothetical protein